MLLRKLKLKSRREDQSKSKLKEKTVRDEMSFQEVYKVDEVDEEEWKEDGGSAVGPHKEKELCIDAEVRQDF